MIELARGSVQNWECDIMGHMNVRHYLARAWGATAALGGMLGLGPKRLRAEGMRLRPVDQHVRFAREMPPGTPFTVRGGVVACRDDARRVYVELRNEASAAVAATVVQDVVLSRGEDAAPAGFPPMEDTLRTLMVEVPEYAAPRGLTFGPPAAPLARSRADALGLARSHQGMLGPEDCDAAGRMRPEAFIARIWDGLPHLSEPMRRVTEGKRLGGAALEYRLVYRGEARVGDVVEVRAGLRAVGGKTSEWCHFLYDAETGEPLAAAASLGVAFDLATRKAVAPDEATLAALRERIVPGLAV